LQNVPEIHPDDPRCVLASAPDFAEAILRLSVLMGHVVARDRVLLVARALAEGGVWTLGELRAAERLIVKDADLMATITYDRTITPRVFEQARKHREVIAGRLLLPDELRPVLRELSGGDDTMLAHLWKNHVQPVRLRVGDNWVSYLTILP
jgi:hypothetical protein